MTAKVGAAVSVLWEDAYHENTERGYSFETFASRHTPKLVIDYGRVIFHDKRGIMLAHEVFVDEDLPVPETRRSKFIPQGMIRKVKALK